MKYSFAIAIVVFALVAGGFSPAVSAGSQDSDSDVSGIGVGPVSNSPDFKSDIDAAREYVESIGSNPLPEATVVVDEERNRHIVFSSDPIPAGEVSASGLHLEWYGEDATILFASQYSVDQSGDSLTMEEFRSEYTDREFDVVEIDGSIALGSVAVKPETGASAQITVGSVNDIGVADSSLIDGSPGQQSRWAAVNLTENDIGLEGGLGDRLPDGGVPAISYQDQFWGSGDATVTAAVIPPSGGISDDERQASGYQLLLIDVDYDSRSVDSPAELQQRGDDLRGETVTVGADSVGTRTSTQEFLTSVVSCGGNTVWIPSTPLCVPIVTDTVVHSGVLGDSTGDETAVVPYAGLSNRVQTAISEPEAGQYEVTGKVVAGEEVDPSLSGQYGLIIQDMERTGELQAVQDVRDELEDRSAGVETAIREQINTSSDQWDANANETDSNGENESGDENGDGSDTDENTESGNSGADGDGSGTDGGSSDGAGGNGESASTVSVTDAELNQTVVDDTMFVSFTFTAKNTGSDVQVAEFDVTRDGEKIDNAWILLEAGEERSRSSRFLAPLPGEHDIAVGGESAGTLIIPGGASQEVESDDGSDAGWADVASLFGTITSTSIVLVGLFVESLRAIKRRFSDDGMWLTQDHTIGVVLMGAVGLCSSGFLGASGPASGLADVAVLSGVLVLLILAAGVGVQYLYRAI